MEDFDVEPVEGRLALNDGSLFFPNRGLRINFQYCFFADGSYRYEIFLEGHPVDPTGYLESIGVPFSAIIVITNNLIIFGNYEPISEDMEVELYLDYHPNDDYELDRVVEMSAVEFGGPKPASRNAVEVLEKFVVRSGVVEIEETNCGVCLEGLVFGSEATKMPCSHALHGDCIVRWLENSCFCPLCRFELPSDSSIVSF